MIKTNIGHHNIGDQRNKMDNLINIIITFNIWQTTNITNIKKYVKHNKDDKWDTKCKSRTSIIIKVNNQQPNVKVNK
jgi:hypothetical protein